MIYYEGSPQVKERRIYLSDAVGTTPPDKNVPTPPDKNVPHNNTSINTTSAKSQSQSQDRDVDPDIDPSTIVVHDKEKAAPTKSGVAESRAAPTMIQESERAAPTAKKEGSEQAATINTLEQYNAYRRIIQANINYADLTFGGRLNPDRDMVDEIVEIMLDVITTVSPDTVKINGEEKSREIVKSVYLKLGYDHIRMVIDQFKDLKYPIKSKKGYLRTMLFNARLEKDLFYTNLMYR